MMKNILCHCVCMWRVLANPVTNVEVFIIIYIHYAYEHKNIISLLMIMTENCAYISFYFCMHI